MQQGQDALNLVADAGQVGRTLDVVVDVGGDAALQVDDLDALGDVVLVDDVGDVAVDGVEGQRFGHVGHLHLLADELVGLLQQLALQPSLLGLGVEVAVHRGVDVGQLGVGTDVVVEEGVGREDLIGHLQVLELLEEALAATLVPEMLQQAVDAAIGVVRALPAPAQPEAR